MSNAGMPMKSILKQRTPTSTTDEEAAAKVESKKRNMSIALNHANRIDLQKKVQLRILDNIVALMDLPSSPRDATKDATTFTTLVHPFQPSDFSSLIEERRINGSCGYALCANAPRSEILGASAVWKLKGKGAADFCSTGCVRKALYVKAQLSEVPAWERVEGQQARVVLPEEDRPAVMEGENASDVEGGVGGKVANGRQLADERGEEPTSFKPRQVMMEAVVEKARTARYVATPPSLPQDQRGNAGYGAIEGYESKFSSKRRGDAESHSDSDDEPEPQPSDGTAFTSEIVDPKDEEQAFDEEEEAAWRDMQVALRELNTGHDR